jgi:hypothetical protein
MVYPKMLLVEEIFINEEFLNWIEKQTPEILDLPTKEIWQKFQERTAE